jgi:hypothetical protein
MSLQIKRKRFKAYKLVKVHLEKLNAERFDDVITNLMKEGWQPYGIPFAIEGGVAQAMVCEGEEKEEAVS